MNHSSSPSVGGKTGIREKKLYKALIAKADARFDRHLARVKAETKTGSKGSKK
jgi:hypothetical protein